MLSVDARLLANGRGRFSFLLGCGAIVLSWFLRSVDAEKSAAEKQYEALCARYRTENELAWTELEKVTDIAERRREFESRHPANSMRTDFLKFEEANRGTLLGLSALHHLVSSAGGTGFAPQFSASEGGRKAMKILADHYTDHPDIDVCFDSVAGGGEDAKSLLRRAMTSSVREVRGAALLKLAEIFAAETQIPSRFDAILELLAVDAEKYADKIELYRSLRQRWTSDPQVSRQKALRSLDESEKEYADVLEPPRTGYGPIVLQVNRAAQDAVTHARRRPLGEKAESIRFQLTSLSIG